jgi:hypothetical protein
VRIVFVLFLFCDFMEGGFLDCVAFFALLAVMISLRS